MITVLKLCRRMSSNLGNVFRGKVLYLPLTFKWVSNKMAIFLHDLYIYIYTTTYIEREINMSKGQNDQM